MSDTTQKARKRKGKKTRFQKISDAADEYGQRSFDNYAQIRSLAEQERNGLCEYLDSERQCVFLVPPQGPFVAQNYGSAAYSVARKGFLPLEPIAFGLGVRVSEAGACASAVRQCAASSDDAIVRMGAMVASGRVEAHYT